MKINISIQFISLIKFNLDCRIDVIACKEKKNCANSINRLNRKIHSQWHHITFPGVLFQVGKINNIQQVYVTYSLSSILLNIQPHQSCAPFTPNVYYNNLFIRTVHWGNLRFNITCTMHMLIVFKHTISSPFFMCIANAQC